MKHIKKIFNSIFNTIVDCLLPTMPIMIGVGMLKVVLIVVTTVLGILSETSNTYIMLSLVADAGFYFLPIFIAIAAAKEFKVNPYIAGVCGAMLVSPKFVALVNANASLSIFGLPVANTDYGNQVLAPIIAIWIMSYVVRLLEKFLNKTLQSIFLPVLTIIIMVPISFCAIGPLGVFLGDKLVELVLSLRSLGPIGNAILCAIIPFVTIFGLGGANLSAMLLLSATGCDEILFFSNVMYNVILGFVTLALYLKNKKSDILASAIASTVGGTSEPALFGFVMKDSKALLSLVAGDFVGGLIAGLLGVKSYAMASFGILGIVATIGPDSSIVNAFIALIAGTIVGFVLSFITHKKVAN